MSAEIATATQFAGELKRHILDFSPAMLPGEVIDARGPDNCTIVRESGSGTMRCHQNRIYNSTVHDYYQADEPGRYLISREVVTDTTNVTGVTGATTQTLVLKLRVTVI